MPTTMITGANRGLGLEFTRQYAADGWKVIATCRDPRAARDLAAVEGDVHVHALDVTDHDAVDALARTLRREAMDVLINNAGIHGPRPSQLGGIDYDAWAKVFEINAMAPLKVCESFADHVTAGEMKIMATISSRMGSISDNNSGASFIYRSSKAALNAVMKSLSVDLKGRGITVAVLHPGWVKTDMGGPSALIGVTDSVTGMRKVIGGLKVSDSGKFFNFDGTEIPW